MTTLGRRRLTHFVGSMAHKVILTLSAELENMTCGSPPEYSSQESNSGPTANRIQVLCDAEAWVAVLYIL